MKTRILLFTGLAIILLTSRITEAQVKYGLHAGLNLEAQAQLGQLWNNCDPYQGYMAGGFLGYGFGKNFTLQAELNYQKKGQKTVYTANGLNSVSRREFNYLSVPLIAKYYVHDAGLPEKCDLIFLAGPYAGFLTSANSKLKAGDTYTPVNIDNVAEKTDAGLIVGAGLRYNLERGRALHAELRYAMGLKQIDAKDADLRNKGMGITVGFNF